jgi:hypothetical protein
MAFDQSTRNRLQRFVSDARTLLTEEFTRQLQHEYGMDPVTCEVVDIDKLTHLDDFRIETARLLRNTLDHYLSTDSSSNKKDVLERIIREQAFTVLNRIVALRMAEAHGFIIESIAKGYQSKGFQLYTHLAGTGLGETGDAYCCYLFSLFDELAMDLSVLFDRFSIHGRLFPKEAVLLQLLEHLNHPDLENLWTEDEVIGWIYQYFNTQEERRQMRVESQSPRNSRELAVRNQFFTPRYVVEFLTDNTLGRIWYEMTKGNTSLKDSCRYLVRRPNEVFLAKGEDAPGREETVNDLSQEELLKQPVYIPFRPLKDPREITMLDPACGSMHFGLYAFDLFELIYKETWELEGEYGTDIFERNNSLKPLRDYYQNRDSFLRDVPRLIIEYNIHGVDIDSRAVQISGLSLWLRAQRTWKQQHVKPINRPQIRKSNIVCAEPMPGEKDLLREFTERLKPRVLGQLVEVVFDKMELAGEAGSLLKIEEEIEDAVEEARNNFNKEIRHRELPKQSALFPETENPKQLSLFDFTDLPSKTDFWYTAEQQILDALHKYAEYVEGSDRLRLRLFAEDATKGFAFIDLCRKRFDVVLMNPPFGDYSIISRSYVQDNYPNCKIEILTAFVNRTHKLINNRGRIGVLSSRTVLFNTNGAGIRSEVFLDEGRLINLADLGYGVLDDAMVEAAAYVIEKVSKKDTTISGIYFRLLKSSNKIEDLLKINDNLKTGCLEKNLFIKNPLIFLNLPGKPFAYWLSNNVLNTFIKWPPLEPAAAEVRTGPSTSDDFRFLRLSWEIPRNQIARSLDETFKMSWVALAKGGEYRPLYDDIHLTINWGKNGNEIKAWAGSLYGGSHWSRILKNVSYFFRPGLTYPKRTTSGFCLRFLPRGCIFSDGGSAIFALNDDESMLYTLGAFFHTRPARQLMEIFLGEGDSTVSGSAARNYLPRAISPIPFPNYKELKIDSDDVITWHSFSLGIFEKDETAREFVRPWKHKKDCCSLNEIVKDIRINYYSDVKTVLDVTSKIEKRVESKYCDASAIDELDEEFGKHPMQFSDVLKTTSHCNIYKYSIEKLVKETIKKCGASRSISKKMFYVDRRIELISRLTKVNPKYICDEMSEIDTADFKKETCLSLTSYSIGCIFGRWDIRYIINDKITYTHRKQFEQLPICPPGMLKNPEGLPATPRDVPNTYSLCITWSGIIVDDEGHNEDIVTRVRESIRVIWKEKSEDTEQELCEILGIRNLREYYSKPTNFFAEHLKLYSKSRRPAPIYWPLSTVSGSYTLWLYYHRLTDQTLYTCVNDFVEPKIKQVTEMVNLLKQKSDRTRQEENELEKLSDMELELNDFRDELLRVAAFWKPNLNDGVQISASPLWPLFRLPKWQKVLKETWQKIERGEYDWAHLAYSIWPERVIRASHRDRSLAIAHDLEKELWEGIEDGTDRQGNIKYKWAPKDLSDDELKLIIKNKTIGL